MKYFFLILCLLLCITSLIGCDNTAVDTTIETSSSTVTVPITTTTAPITTTQAPITTTQAPITTSQAPITSENPYASISVPEHKYICRVLRDEQEVFLKNPVYYNTQAHRYEIPLLSMMELFGAKIVWQDSFVAKIEMNNKSYILDTQINSFYDMIYDEETSKILCDPPPGTTSKNMYFEMINQELYTSWYHAWCVMYCFGRNFKVDKDTKDTVYLDVYPIER